MFSKKLCVAFIAFLLLHDTVQGKKRRNKRPKPEEEDVYTPQPSVVSYSTFGFNDVGTYEGFVPSSPDYTKFLTNNNQESSTKDQSGFTTASDSNDFSNNYNNQAYSGHSFSMIDDGGVQTATLIHYPQSPPAHFPSSDPNGDQHRNVAIDNIYGRHTEDVNAPTYGTKLKSRNRMRPNQFNNTDFSGPSGMQNEEKYQSFQESKPSFENRPLNFQESKPAFESRPVNEISPTLENKPAFSEANINFYNTPTYLPNSINENNKPVSSDSLNSIKFQRVVDFTKLKQSQPLELDMSRLPAATPLPDVYENNETPNNNYLNTYDVNNNSQKNFFNPAIKQRDTQKPNINNEDTFEKNAFKAVNFKEDPYRFGGYESGKDNLIQSQSDYETKKKNNRKPWLAGGHLIKKWKEPSPSKGYEYSTNYSSMSFSYDSDKEKIVKPLGSNIDELVPASSNIDLPNYQFPDIDFTNFKKMPEYKVHEEDEYANFPSFKDLSKPNEIDYDQYKQSHTTTPTSTAYWGNAFKSLEHASFKNHPNSYNKYKFRDNEEIVNIPRRPNRYEKPYESKTNEWSHHNRRPQRNRPYKDWNSDITTRFKSEEDLLGLRNQDTSHPSYLPSYQSNNFGSEEVDYKKLVDKWRQAYLKSKFKDSLRDYESYGSETKPKHVPVPKPYPVPVPVVKPYPVHVPYIRPVFHHTKSRDEYDSDHRDDDDYLPRPEGKNKYLQYKNKLPNGSRNRSRRPSRTAHQDRNRRRWPDRRRPADTRDDLPRVRPMELHHPSPFKRRDIETSTYYL